MKRLRDYTGNEAIELWADLIEPASVLLSDETVQKMRAEHATVASVASYLMKEHSEEVTGILLRVDPEPINAINAPIRLMTVLMDIINSPEFKDFFGLQGQMVEEGYSGSVTGNTEVEGR